MTYKSNFRIEAMKRLKGSDKDRLDGFISGVERIVVTAPDVDMSALIEQKEKYQKAILHSNELLELQQEGGAEPALLKDAIQKAELFITLGEILKTEDKINELTYRDVFVFAYMRFAFENYFPDHIIEGTETSDILILAEDLLGKPIPKHINDYLDKFTSIQRFLLYMSCPDKEILKNTA